MGMNTFQPSAMSWSYRKRGRVQRTHMKRNRKKRHLAKKTTAVTRNCAIPPASSQCVNGMSQPPRKRVVNIMAIVTMAANSAIMNAENFMALYSVW